MASAAAAAASHVATHSARDGASADLADLDLESDLLGPRMGAEARIRFQAARLKGMQDELQKLIAEVNEKDQACAALAGSCKQAEDENRRLAKRLLEAESAADKLKRTAAEAVQRATAHEADAAAARKEADAQDKARRALEAEKRARDVRLNRALEEADKLRAQLKEAKEAKTDGSDAGRAECARLAAEVKRLGRQKTEILNAFKKQMKLVDILKRQKVWLNHAG